MGLAVLIFFLLPWLDVSPVKSVRYKGGLYKTALTIFVIAFLVLGYFGTQPVTREGTFMAACDRLKSLADLGITAIELMPVADFPGRFGWGYDGVLPFAPHGTYGTPDELKQNEWVRRSNLGALAT